LRWCFNFAYIYDVPDSFIAYNHVALDPVQNAPKVEMKGGDIRIS